MPRMLQRMDAAPIIDAAMILPDATPDFRAMMPATLIFAAIAAIRHDSSLRCCARHAAEITLRRVIFFSCHARPPRLPRH